MAPGAYSRAVDNPAPITDPYSVLVGLGALCALVAASQWWVVASGSAKIIAPDGFRVRRALGIAAAFSGLAMALTAVGYLLGRFSGRF